LLDESDERAPTEGARGRLLDPATQHAFADLDASQVDVIDAAGAVDPLDFVPDEVAECLRSPELLFEGNQARLTTAARMPDKDRLEYCRLTSIQLRSGKLDLATEVRATASIFTVGKKSSSKLREVWNGSLISSAAKQPPCPPPERLLHKGQIKHTKSLVPQPPPTPPPERLLQAKGKDGPGKKNKEDKKASGKKSEERQLELEARKMRLLELEARKMKLLETKATLEESADTRRRQSILQKLIDRLVEAGCPGATVDPYMQSKRCKVHRPETDPYM
jgi:hypothetical protein